MFRSKTEDILIRGTYKSCDVVGDLGDEIIRRKYKWIAHSHVDMGALVESADDRATFNLLGQKTSKIVSIKGEEIEFGGSPF